MTSTFLEIFFGALCIIYNADLIFCIISKSHLLSFNFIFRKKKVTSRYICILNLKGTNTIHTRHVVIFQEIVFLGRRIRSLEINLMMTRCMYKLLIKLT